MKYIWIILGIIIVVVVGYFIYRGAYGYKTTSSSPSLTAIAADTVVAKNSAFSPNELTVSVGTEVTFKNEDSATHTFVGDGFESGNVKQGDSFKFTFNTAGTFNYHCSIHPSMTGKIIVK
jgi:plastocyanin